MLPLSDLLDKNEVKKYVRTSERAELLRFFIDNLRQKNGKPFSARMIAFKLSHLKLPDLYYTKSVFSDILKCKGLDSASKWFWFSIRVAKK